MSRPLRILCTLGPASLDPQTIRRLDTLGVDLFRINLSHTVLADVERAIRLIQQATGKPICLDTEGAQVRNRYVEGGRIVLQDNAMLELSGEEGVGTPAHLTLHPASVVAELPVGALIDIDFHSVMLQVVANRGNRVTARVVSGGEVGSNKAVTVDAPVSLPVLTPKDREACVLGRALGVRHFALSFAASRAGVLALRALVGDDTTIIAKIESRVGVAHVEDIMDVSDALLIDRGDLSREVPLESIPLLQKMLIARANARQKPVYVATNLLESMIDRTKPTRAEANDVMNTLLDGATGLVLAAETAIGKHPAACVAMVASLIDQYDRVGRVGTPEQLLADTGGFVTAPHGGVLVNGVVDTLPPLDGALVVDERVLMDAEQIAIGTFSPLTGFMNRATLESVLRNYQLPTGTSWPLPILLPCSAAQELRVGAVVGLAGADGTVHAALEVEEIFTYDLPTLAREIFGTDDMNHAGVAALWQQGNCFVAGRVQMVRRLVRPYKHFELTPRQTRKIFTNKGWRRVVGFHTRNVIHRAHETVQLTALERCGADGLLVHPVVGPKKRDDYTADAILRSYELMVNQFYPAGKVVLGAFATFSRYAGPREAVFTALCRKNFGCSHFIVGRDHTGVGGYYGADASQQLFREMGDLGITPVFFEQVGYCQRCDRHVEQCAHGTAERLAISGTQARQMLRQGESPPDWFMRGAIADLLLAQMAQGEPVFVRD